MASIQAAILCDFAQVREGVLFVSSGGINRMYRAQTPAPMGVYLALVVDVGPEEVHRVHSIRIIVTALAAGLRLGELNAALEVERSPGTDPALPILAPIAIDLNPIALPDYGR